MKPEGWLDENNQLIKTFEFQSFENAIDFINRCSVHISKLDHHPAWTNIYNKVSVALTTHDQGNVVTEKDFELAKLMDEIFNENYQHSQ